MLRKAISIILVFVMLFAIVGCDSNNSSKKNYKIGIITGTVSQGEEEFQQAQKLQEQYGDMIVTATYPDNFSSETETTISNVVSLASDPDVKAIVFVQAVPGACAAIDKVRETRPDMLFICGVAAEDPATIAKKSDIVMLVDEISMGDTIPQKAFDMGAKTLIHYTFARHMSYATIAARHDRMAQKCKELGIQFVDVTAPDPLSDAGVAGAQQFIIDDVPRQVATYGKDTAFFSTNCSMQEPLIRSVLNEKAIFPQQCCPSPYHGYPAALGIDVTGHQGDVDYMIQSIKDVLKENGQEGRMTTWGVPINMLMIRAGVNYAIEFCEGRTEGRYDDKVFNEVLDKLSKETGKITVSRYEDPSIGKINNFYMLLCDFYDFSK